MTEQPKATAYEELVEKIAEEKPDSVEEMVRGLQEQSQKLEGKLPWCESCVYGACRHISKNVDRDYYSSCEHEGQMFGYDGNFIARVCNNFPRIATAFLQQQERIKELEEEKENDHKYINFLICKRAVLEEQVRVAREELEKISNTYLADMDTLRKMARDAFSHLSPTTDEQ